MRFDPLQPLPLVTANLLGIGGRIKCFPEDFEVEEIPAYEPSGSGDFLYLWLEKRDMGAEYFVRQVAHRLGVAVGDVGTAGLKDRHAVTRQMVSVPAQASSQLELLAGDDIRVIRVSRHSNKLRPGHLHGNRFRILVRGVHPAAGERLGPLLDRLLREGLPNFYGPQRFGHEGETVQIGLALLRGEPPPLSAAGKNPNLRSPFLRKLALSAAQSALFNHYLACRTTEGLLRRVLPGDVMAKRPFGGLFVVQDVDREQARFNAREIVSAGPIFGRKTFTATAAAAEREAAVLRDAGLRPAVWNGFGKLVQGTRRHNLIYVDDLTAVLEPDGVRLTFTLPAGSYATILLREITKNEALVSCEET
jgi:tRNA pseudouridine13 synthase